VVGSLGLALAELTDAQKRDMKLKNGVPVESAEGVAARAGVKEGDVIVTLDNVEVTSVKQFDAAVAKLDKAKSVTLLVRQGEVAKFLILKPPR
jgi:serine protease Do